MTLGERMPMRLQIVRNPLFRESVGPAPVRYNLAMPPERPARRRQRTPPPGETGQEALYLRSLSERQVPVHVKLRDGETVSGWIEYFDDRMIRLTREGKPNLFIYKHQIRTITEHGRDGRRRPRRDDGVGAEDAQ
jgi:host factor-I protein